MRNKVTKENRTVRNGHKGFVIWLTGLSASGKTTIAYKLERKLFDAGKQVCVLDADDNIRSGLCVDLGFTEEGRIENVRRVAEVARLFMQNGIICITALISPFDASRFYARSLIPRGQFIEVYLNTSLHVCETRDSKGLYKRARLGEIKQFTGISSPYEPPICPELTLDTALLSSDACVDEIMDYLHLRDVETQVSI